MTIAPSTSGGSTSRCPASHAMTPASTSSTAPLICADRISARPSPNVNGPRGGRAARRAATSASAIAPASVSMCAASESSASDEARTPATTSTPMKPRTIASATASQRRSASDDTAWRMAVVVVLVRCGVRVRCHKRVTKSGRALYSQAPLPGPATGSEGILTHACPPQPRSRPARARAARSSWSRACRSSAGSRRAVIWALWRGIGEWSDRRAAAATSPRQTAGIAAGSMVGRGWLLGLILLGAGLAAGEDVGLSAAVLVLVALHRPLHLQAHPAVAPTPQRPSHHMTLSTRGKVFLGLARPPRRSR